MQSKVIKKIEISKKLSLISENKIDEVDNFIELILSKSPIQSRRKPVKLRGIWKNRGFEKIKDTESELKEIRTRLTHSIKFFDIPIIPSDRKFKEVQGIKVIWD